MAEPIRVDSHVHVFAAAVGGLAAKEAYEIQEYGAPTVIEFLGRICAQPWWAARREAWLEERGKSA